VSLLGLQDLTDLELIGINASVEFLESLERDAGLLGDGAEGLALGDDMLARTRSGSALAGTGVGHWLGSDFLESGDLLTEDFLVGTGVGETLVEVGAEGLDVSGVGFAGDGGAEFGDAGLGTSSFKVGGFSSALGLDALHEAGGAESETEDTHDKRELGFGRGGGDIVVFHVWRCFAGWNTWRLAV